MATGTITQRLNVLMKNLTTSTPDIEAASVVSVDGLVMASALPTDVDEDRLAAMSAAMLALGERTVRELAKGELEQVFVRGTEGYIIMTGAGEEAVLVVIANKDAKLGLIFLDVKRAAEEILSIL